MTAPLLRCYGGFSIEADGRPLSLPTVKTRVLLVYLLHGPQRRYPRRMLASLFWPDLPEQRGLANLSTALSLLRSSLPDRALTISQDSQSIAVDYGTLHSDQAQVADLSARMAAHPHRSRAWCAHCAPLIDEAVRMIGGVWLAGIELWECDQLQHWLTIERERQRQLMIELLMTLIEQRERQAQFDGVIVLAEQLLQYEPWHEDAFAALLRAMAARGQRLSALARYRCFAADLQREFAAEPHAPLQTLAEQLRRTAAPLPPAPPATPAGSPLFGRQTELAQLIDWFSRTDRRLVTISGIGGVGKTSLALAAARLLAPWLRDGVAVVRLEGIDDEAGALLQIAQTLDLRLGAQAAPLDLLVERLDDRELLLVLDNVEQLPAAARICSTVLQHTRTVMLLVTSRRPLQLWQEQVLTLQGLSVDRQHPEDDTAAAALFRARLQRMFGADALPPPAVISAICRAVGGLPLAIELAAAQLRRQSADQLLLQLQQDGDLLTADAEDLPARQQQLTAILAYACSDLAEDDLAALASLSVSRGELKDAALAAVLPQAGQAGRMLQQLLDRGLINRHGARRELHPLVRAFVQRHTGTEQLRAARLRHLHYWLGRLAAAELHVIDQQSRRRAHELAADYDNLHAAWLYAADAQPSALGRLVPALLVLLLCEGWYTAGAELFEQTAAVGVDHALAAACLIAAGRLRFYAGEYGPVRRLARAARRYGSAPQITAEAAGLRAMVLHEAGRYHAAERMAALGLQHYAVAGNDLQARLLYVRARAQMWADRLNEARQGYEAALAISRDYANRGLEIDCLNALAQLPARAGDLAAALPLLEQAADQTALHGDPHAQVVAMINVGTVRALLGIDVDSALQLMQQALTRVRDTGNRRAIASVLHSAAYGLLHLDRLTEAADLLREGLHAAEAIAHRGFVLEMMEGAALLAVRRRQLPAARRWLQVLCREAETPPFVRRRAAHTLSGLDSAESPVDVPSLTVAAACAEVRRYLTEPTADRA